MVESVRESQSEHQAILKACEERNAEFATLLVREHLENSLRYLANYIDEGEEHASSVNSIF